MSYKKFSLLMVNIMLVLFLAACSTNLKFASKQGNGQTPSNHAPKITTSILPTSTNRKSVTNNNSKLTQVEGTKGLWVIQDDESKHYNDSTKRFESWYKKLTVEDLNLIHTVVSNIELSNIQDNKEFMMLLSVIPENNIYLYGCRQGIILRHNDYFQFFDWNYLTPLGVLPEMCFADYDGDGQKEVAISAHIVSGTGVSIDSLHLVKLRENGTTQEFEFTRERYIKQLENSITGNYNKVTGLLQFYINGERTGKSIDISKMTKELGNYRGIEFGQQISIHISKNEIIMNITPELYLDGACTPNYDMMPNISTKVVFNNNTFSLAILKYKDAKD